MKTLRLRFLLSEFELRYSERVGILRQLFFYSLLFGSLGGGGLIIIVAIGTRYTAWYQFVIVVVSYFCAGKRKCLAEYRSVGVGRGVIAAEAEIAETV